MGRRKGSLNKSKSDKEKEKSENQSTIKRGRGRPKGSVNKSKNVIASTSNIITNNNNNNSNTTITSNITNTTISTSTNNTTNIRSFDNPVLNNLYNSKTYTNYKSINRVIVNNSDNLRYSKTPKVQYKQVINNSNTVIPSSKTSINLFELLPPSISRRQNQVFEQPSVPIFKNYPTRESDNENNDESYDFLNDIVKDSQTLKFVLSKDISENESFLLQNIDPKDSNIVFTSQTIRSNSDNNIIESNTLSQKINLDNNTIELFRENPNDFLIELIGEDVLNDLTNNLGDDENLEITVINSQNVRNNSDVDNVLINIYDKEKHEISVNENVDDLFNNIDKDSTIDKDSEEEFNELFITQREKKLESSEESIIDLDIENSNNSNSNSNNYQKKYIKFNDESTTSEDDSTNRNINNTNTNNNNTSDNSSSDSNSYEDSYIIPSQAHKLLLDKMKLTNPEEYKNNMKLLSEKYTLFEKSESSEDEDLFEYVFNDKTRYSPLLEVSDEDSINNIIIENNHRNENVIDNDTSRDGDEDNNTDDDIVNEILTLNNNAISTTTTTTNSTITSTTSSNKKKKNTIADMLLRNNTRDTKPKNTIVINIKINESDNSKSKKRKLPSTFKSKNNPPPPSKSKTNPSGKLFTFGWAKPPNPNLDPNNSNTNKK